MKLNSLHKRLIKDLFKSPEGLFIFTLYQRYNLSPKELFLSLQELINLELIESDNVRIGITKRGFDFAINSNLNGINKVKNKKEIPKEFLGPKIGINQFYIPKVKVLSNELLDL